MNLGNAGHRHGLVAAIQIYTQLILPTGLASKIGKFHLRGGLVRSRHGQYQLAATSLPLAQQLTLLTKGIQLLLLPMPNLRPLVDSCLPLRHRFANGLPGAGPFFYRHLGKYGLSLRRLPHQGLKVIDLLLIKIIGCLGFGHGLFQLANCGLQLSPVY